MKAAVSTRYGPPEVVRLEEVDKPTAGRDELLIKVRATTVNRTDCGYREGTPFLIRLFSGLRRPKVFVLGTEFAGEVVAVGTDVTSSTADTGIDHTSYVQCELIRWINRNRLVRRLGSIDPDASSQVATIIKTLLSY